jgi:hypothetical protein
VAAEFDQRIGAAEDEATAKILKVQRRLLVHYTDFPIDQRVQAILAGLNA